MPAYYSEERLPDEMGLHVYYRLPGGKLTQYLVSCPVQPMEAAIEFCTKTVRDTVPNAYNLAVLAVIPGGKV
jgi:hypothetical protein